VGGFASSIPVAVGLVAAIGEVRTGEKFALAGGMIAATGAVIAMRGIDRS
jgi:hypothetical protein